jgi:hypothetical protein
MYLDIAGMIMLQKQLCKSFARALHKTTLIVMLPLSMAAAPAWGQEASPAVAPPAATTEVVQDTLYLKNGVTVTIHPQTESTVESLEARYPFLKEVLADVREHNEEHENSTRVLTTAVRDTESNTDLLFVSVVGPLTCGINSCQLNIFSNDGTGYKSALSVPAQAPLYAVKSDNEISLFFCSGDRQRSQWVLNNDGRFEHKGNVTHPQIGPACHKFSISD